LNNKVILITGGSRGLGAEFVKSLSADEGNLVFYTYSDASSGCQPGGNVTPLLCDQRNEPDIVDCVAEIISAQGKIDVLVNNACPVFRPCGLADSDWSMFQELIDVNVKGAYVFMREAARSMKQNRSGRIVNILSSYVLGVPPEKLSFYITAKYALAGLSKAAAAELGRYGITVNMISPGMMDTRLTGYLPARYLEAYRQKHPMNRMTSPDDVAEALKFLISDGAQFINGVNISVNGGEAF
jgi:3-oxoacyl-[acyl-carrier protein] reductase